MKKVLVAAKIHPDAVDLLRDYNGIKVEEVPYPDEESLLEKIKDVHGIIVRSKPQLPAEIIEAGENLEVIGRAGVGLDTIDTEKAEDLGIEVKNVPEAPTRSVAEHAITLMLGASREVGKAHHGLKNNEWRKDDIMGNELKGKNLGILGFGKIGYETAKIGNALGMNISYFDCREGIDYGEDIDAVCTDNLGALLVSSDFISVHVPLNPSTSNLIGEKELKKMKDSAIIVNTSRGGIINKEDLANAIKNNEIKAAGMDVYTEEPPNDENPLLDLDNILLTCHVGSTTEEAQRRTGVMTAEKLIEVLD